MCDWLASHVRAFEFFGGTTNPDNLKSGVTKASRYDHLNPESVIRLRQNMQSVAPRLEIIYGIKR